MDNDYEKFQDVYLSEMPQRAPGNNDFEIQLMVLQENITNGGRVISMSDTFHKMITDVTHSYWFGTSDLSEVRMIVDTTMYYNLCRVRLTSKNPDYKTPYESDVYQMIADDVGKSISFTSDSTLSDEAIKLWKGMVTRGSTISVFDKTLGKYALQAVKTSDELTTYITDDVNGTRYVFVLHNNLSEYRSEWTEVSLMEIKRHMYGEHFKKFFK